MLGKTELDNLLSLGQLKPAKVNDAEIRALIASGAARLVDADKQELAIESRFDLAYGAAHSFAVAALRRLGYRSENRITVFQALAHTLGTSMPAIRTLVNCHRVRNAMEYDGAAVVDEKLVSALVSAAATVQAELATAMAKEKS